MRIISPYKDYYDHSVPGHSFSSVGSNERNTELIYSRQPDTESFGYYSNSKKVLNSKFGIDITEVVPFCGIKNSGILFFAGKAYPFIAKGTSLFNYSDEWLMGGTEATKRLYSSEQKKRMDFSSSVRSVELLRNPIVCYSLEEENEAAEIVKELRAKYSKQATRQFEPFGKNETKADHFNLAYRSFSSKQVFTLEKDALYQKAIDAKLVSFVVYSDRYHNLSIVINPVLRELGFQNVMTSEQAYQEIEMFLGYIKTAEEIRGTKLPMTEAQKVQAHGFTKESFRPKSRAA